MRLLTPLTTGVAAGLALALGASSAHAQVPPVMAPPPVALPPWPDTTLIRHGDTVWSRPRVGILTVAVRQGDTVSLRITIDGRTVERVFVMDSTGRSAIAIAYADTIGVRHTIATDKTPPRMQEMMARVIATMFSRDEP